MQGRAVRETAGLRPTAGSRLRVIANSLAKRALATGIAEVANGGVMLLTGDATA